VATASLAGSLVAFLVSRSILKDYVQGRIGQDKRFVALGQALRHQELGVLVALRMCPLPYSLINGFLATMPSTRISSFMLATALAT
jgi:uncharacterized membrane protein YdjX (TVP38/TMEM64 family)